MYSKWVVLSLGFERATLSGASARGQTLCTSGLPT